VGAGAQRPRPPQEERQVEGKAVERPLGRRLGGRSSETRTPNALPAPSTAAILRIGIYTHPLKGLLGGIPLSSLVHHF
jgi:hypothetical protein